MKKIFMLVCVFCAFFAIQVNASECSDAVLKDASNVEVESVPIVGEDIYYQIKIKNMTENIFVKVYEDDNETTTIYEYKDAVGGVITIDHWYIYEKVNYTVMVYAANEDCIDTLKTLEVSTKKFNDRYNMAVCEENPTYERCEPFYDETAKEEEQSKEEFYEEVKEHEKRENAGFWGKVWYVIQDYYLYVLIPLLVIGGGYIIAIIVFKRKKSGEEK